MKLYKYKEWSDRSLRQVRKDHRIIGIVGTVADLLSVEVLEYCDYPGETWCFIPRSVRYKAIFSGTREELIKMLKESIK